MSFGWITYIAQPSRLPSSIITANIYAGEMLRTSDLHLLHQDKVFLLELTVLSCRELAKSSDLRDS